MRRRDGTGLMDGMWELPELDRRSQLATGGDIRSEEEPLQVDRLEPFTSFRHTITYRRLKVEVFRATLLAEPCGRDYRWVTTTRVRRLPASSMVAKALRKLTDGRGA
jgi:adenine-specific DNA glycosylase